MLKLLQAVAFLSESKIEAVVEDGVKRRTIGLKWYGGDGLPERWFEMVTAEAAANLKDELHGRK
jgi:hypothetical protein